MMLEHGHTVRIDEVRVGLATHAMIDAIDGKDLERLAHVVGTAFFAGMRHRAPAVVAAREREGLAELRRRMPNLGATQAEPEQLVAPGFEYGDHRERVVFIELALDAGDEAAGDAMARAGIGEGREDRLDHHLDGDTA
jgi:hypothetical protein